MAHIGKKCHQNGVNPDIQRTKAKRGRSVFITIECESWPLERFFRSSMVVLPTIQGKYSRFEAKSAHIPS